MKKYFTLAVILCAVACGDFRKPWEPCPPCPTPPACPTPPQCAECPVPPVQPSYEDVEHDSTEFEMTAILADTNTLGLYVIHPAGNYTFGIFVMPELKQNQQYEPILSLVKDPNTSYDVGVTAAKESDSGLTLSALCEREFAPVCTAKVFTNGPSIKRLTITMAEDPNATFNWTSK